MAGPEENLESMYIDAGDADAHDADAGRCSVWVLPYWPSSADGRCTVPRTSNVRVFRIVTTD